VDAALVVLAAGEGRRAGGPKAWRMVAGRPWLAHQLEAVASLALAPVAVVLAAPPAQDSGPWPALARWAINPRPERGPFSSLQVGLLEVRAAGAAGSPVFVLPVDVPAAGPEVFVALRAGLGDAPAAIPVLRERGGHPVLLSAAACGELCGLDPASPQARLDVWLRGKGPAVRRIPVADERVLSDFNTPEDFGGTP
jgi:molybdenum cofactor cytidylyltransferase